MCMAPINQSRYHDKLEKVQRRATKVKTDPSRVFRPFFNIFPTFFKLGFLFQTVEAMATITPIFLRQICTTSRSCAQPIWLTEARRLKTPQLPRDLLSLKNKVTQMKSIQVYVLYYFKLTKPLQAAFNM